MHNKKVLQTAIKELDKRKAPPAPKDIITDPAGQWKYPGLPTRIPSNEITMQGVNYPVLGVPDKGEPTMMHPGGYYNFPEANYVDEYPQMKKGGGLKSKKYTKNIMGKSYLFEEGPLFKKKKESKKRIFHPNAKYYQDGGEPGDKFKKRLMKRYPGMQDVYGPEGENLNIVKDPNYDARSAGYGDIEFTFPGDDPVINYPNLVEEGGPDYNYPNPSPDKYTALYNPRGANRGDVFLDMMHGMRDDPNYLPLLQNFEKAVRDARGEDMDWYYDQQVKKGSTQSKERYDENYVDSQLRAELAPGSIGMFSKGRKDYRIDRKYDSPEMRAAAKDIRNYLKGKPTEEDYIEADLTPEEIQEYAKGGYVIEELDGYAEGGDPGDVKCPPGYVYNPETKYCEKKSGCPEGFTFDPKSGRCVSNYKKESIKIMTAPYKYYNKETGDPEMIGFPIKNPESYKDSELVEATPEQLTIPKSSSLAWPKDFTINEISNPIYIRPSTLYSIKRPDFKEEYVGETEYEIEGFPDLNYKVVVDPKKPEGFNKDENIYYVKSENTHQFKKYKEWEKLKALEKQNLENAKKYGFDIVKAHPQTGTKYADDYYRKLLYETVDGEKTVRYDEDGNNMYEYSPEWDEKKYYQENKTPIQEWYNDPEYLGDVAYDKSFEEVYKDRGIKNVQKYSGWCPQCAYYHGQRYKVDDDYIYKSYNPNDNPIVQGQFNKPIKTLENEYADPNIVQQIPTMEEYEYPDAPGYNPVDYKGVGIHPVWSHGHKQKKHFMADPNRGKRGSLDDMFYMYTTFEDTPHLKGFGKHPRTKVIPSIVQKSTGYNPQAMEGYYNEEGDWVPGEYEKAEEEGRKINFQGAASLRDLKRQKEYLSKYDDYMKEREKIDEMNQQLREEWLPPVQYAGEYAKGGSSCPPGYIKINGKCKKYKEVAPFITSDPEEYAYRKAAYEDSLYLANKYNPQQPKTKKYLKYEGVLGADFKGKAVKVKKGYVPTNRKLSYIMDDNYSKLSPAWKKFISDPNRKGDRTGRYHYFDNQPIGYQWEEAFFDTHALNTPFGVKTFTLPGEEQYSRVDVRPRFQPPKQQVIFQQPPKPKPKVHQYPTEHKPAVNNIPPGVSKSDIEKGKVVVGDKVITGYQEEQQLDPKTGKVTTVINPVYEDLEKPIPTLHPTRVNPELKKFVYPETETEGEDEMPVYDDTDIETGTPDPGGHWEDKYSRYIDWDGNSIGFNGIRFRKPGHGGDLIKKGRRHYIHYPSIERRYDAWIEPDELPEEEYQNGGEYNIGDEVELTEAEVKRLRSLGYIIEEA